MRASNIVLAAAAVASVAQAGDWRYGLPDTGMAPSYGKVEIFTRMSERHGDKSDFSLQSYGLTIPFADPRKTGFGDTLLNVQLDAKLNVVNGGGSFRPENELLYNFSLPITFITPGQHNTRWTYGIAPEVAADSATFSKGTDALLYGFCTVKYSENFNYTLGLAASPRFSRYLVLPVLRFEWEPNERWTVDMKGYEVRAMYHATERLSFGPFVGGRVGMWAVETPRGARFLRVRSLVVGAGLEYDFSQPGQTKRIFTAAVGSTVATHAQYCERNADKDAYESHHYKPGFYVSAGVDFRF